jgi:hypothetical protein
MALRSWRMLTIALLLASAAPPPRVTNALIAATHRSDRAEGGKTVQSRARNRIASPVQIAAPRDISGLSRGWSRPIPSPSHFARRADIPTAIRPPSPALRSSFRLRC